jgi:hypothetical protein
MEPLYVLTVIKAGERQEMSDISYVKTGVPGSSPRLSYS